MLVPFGTSLHAAKQLAVLNEISHMSLLFWSGLISAQNVQSLKLAVPRFHCRQRFTLLQVFLSVLGARFLVSLQGDNSGWFKPEWPDCISVPWLESWKPCRIHCATVRHPLSRNIPSCFPPEVLATIWASGLGSCSIFQATVWASVLGSCSISQMTCKKKSL